MINLNSLQEIINTSHKVLRDVREVDWVARSIVAILKTSDDEIPLTEKIDMVMGKAAQITAVTEKYNN